VQFVVVRIRDGRVHATAIAIFLVFFNATAFASFAVAFRFFKI